MSSLSNSQATYILSIYIHSAKERKEGREGEMERERDREGEREKGKRGERKTAQAKNLSYK